MSLKKGMMVMNRFFVLFALCSCSVFANEPTLATTDTATSVLQKEATQTAQVSQPAVAPAQSDIVTTSAVLVDNTACVSGKCGNNVNYRRKDNIAPCAVNKTVVMSFCETSCEDCQKVTHKKDVAVDICVPPCACKETVSSHRGGRRVVYDYGKYEVEVLARRNGDVDVNYKKRLLNR